MITKFNNSDTEIYKITENILHENIFTSYKHTKPTEKGKNNYIIHIKEYRYLKGEVESREGEDDSVHTTTEINRGS